MKLRASSLALLGSLLSALPTSAASSPRLPDGAPSHPFSVDYFGRRLAEAVAEEGGGELMVTTTSDEPESPSELVTCPEGYDDDATLATFALARQYGLDNCKKAHDMLLQFMDSADMLCVSIAPNVCNCTCAGTVLAPSVKAEAIPFGQAEDLSPPSDEAFDCNDVAANGGEKNAALLPDDVRGWRCEELGEVGVLLWYVDDSGETVTFAAEFVSAGGAAAVGISSNGGMFGADLLWVGKDGEGDDIAWVVKDMFSRGYSPEGDLVTLDESQDVTLDWSQEADGRLAFKVSRPVKSCDTEDDLEILAGPIPILWARFPGHSRMYHGPSTNDRGTVYLDLLNPHNEGIPEKPEDLFAVDLRFSDSIGDSEPQRYVLEDGRVNSYVCRSFEVPSDRPYHIVSYEAILDTIPADANVVHHIVLYSCDEDPNLPNPHMCSAMNAGCYSVDIAWAVGIPRQYLPEVAGLPMKKYFYMEMHYENLSQLSGIKDGSGLRLTFTPELREQDYGYVIVGSDLSRTPDLEPGRDDLVRSGFCPSECTARSLPADGVSVHAMFFHAHLAGRALRTQQVRDGKELQPLGDMPYYDFNHQFFKYASHQPKLMPGDELVTTCHYSTSDADGPTKFGLETRDEMCFNMMGVYPAVDMKYCVNRTVGGGRCWWGDEEEVTAGIVPYVPFVEDVPERCSSADGVPPSGDGSASADGPDVLEQQPADEIDDAPGSSVGSSAEGLFISRLILSSLVLIPAKLMLL